MKLSIVVLVYNQKNYVSKTIDSIINQATDYDFEVIIGDDCSVDGTKDIVIEYAKKYPKIIKPVIRNTNLGLIRNYFSLMAECKGEYIMECAGDDYWLPGKINKQISYMDNNPDVSMVCSGYQRVDERDNWLSEDITIPKTDFSSLFKGNQIAALTVCFRKDIIDKYIQEINPIERGWKMEDYPFWLWISKKGKIAFIPEILCSYRIVDGSISHPKAIEQKISFESSVCDIRLFFSRNDAETELAYRLFNGNVSMIIYRNMGLLHLVNYLYKEKIIINFLLFALGKVKDKYFTIF